MSRSTLSAFALATLLVASLVLFYTSAGKYSLSVDLTSDLDRSKAFKVHSLGSGSGAKDEFEQQEETAGQDLSFERCYANFVEGNEGSEEPVLSSSSVLVHRARPGSMQYNHMAMIERIHNGSLALAWQTSSGIEGVSDQTIVLSVSTDETGRSWNRPRMIPVERKGPLWAPVLHYDDHGGRRRLVLFYAESSGCIIHKGGVKRYSPGGDVKSTFWDLEEEEESNTDADFVWSPPQLVHAQKKGDGLPKVLANKMIELRTGEWVLPMWSEKHGGGVCQKSKEKGSAGVLVSSDKGATWERRGKLQASDTWLIENTVVEMNGVVGSMLMLFRTKKGFIYASETSDGGYTWSQPTKTEHENPDSKIHALRLSDKALALAYNNHKKFLKPQRKGCRTNLDLALSLDDGQSWKTLARLERKIDAGLRSHYPTLYYSREHCRLHVAYTKFYHESVQYKSKWELFQQQSDSDTSPPQQQQGPPNAPVLGVFVASFDFSI